MPPMVKTLLKQGSITNIDSQGRGGNTPLILAIKQKNIGVIKEILKEVPRIDIKNNDGKTAMDIALAMPETSAKEKTLKEKIIKLLKQAQIQNDFEAAVKKITSQQKQKPSIDEIEEFIKQGASVNIPRDENNPLYRAVKWNELDLVKLLIKYNVDINQRTKKGKIPLVMAAEYSGPEIVKALLQKGADPNSIDAEGNTPLINVINRIFSKFELEKSDLGFDIFQQLIAAGADPLMQNPYEETAFDLAKEYQKLFATPPDTSGLNENEKKSKRSATTKENRILKKLFNF